MRPAASSNPAKTSTELNPARASKPELPVAERKLLSERHARQFLGNPSKTRLYEYTKQGLIESVKIQGRRFWVTSSLIEFVDRHRKNGEAA